MTEPARTTEERSAEIMAALRAVREPQILKSYARLGIRNAEAIGVRVPEIRKIARSYRGAPRLAGMLWRTGVHEARIMATIIMPPNDVSSATLDRWLEDCRSWDLVDACCVNLASKTPFAWDMVSPWCNKPGEYTRRAGFVLLAALAVHDKKADCRAFLKFLSVIEEGAHDPRNFVKKAVSWALRAIGKRNPALHRHASACAQCLARSEMATAKWVGRDALRELRHEKVFARLGLDGDIIDL